MKLGVWHVASRKCSCVTIFYHCSCFGVVVAAVAFMIRVILCSGAPCICPPPLLLFQERPLTRLFFIVSSLGAHAAADDNAGSNSWDGDSRGPQWLGVATGLAASPSSHASPPVPPSASMPPARRVGRGLGGCI